MTLESSDASRRKSRLFERKGAGSRCGNRLQDNLGNLGFLHLKFLHLQFLKINVTSRLFGLGILGRPRPQFWHRSRRAGNFRMTSRLCCPSARRLSHMVIRKQTASRAPSLISDRHPRAMGKPPPNCDQPFELKILFRAHLMLNETRTVFDPPRQDRLLERVDILHKARLVAWDEGILSMKVVT